VISTLHLGRWWGDERLPLAHVIADPKVANERRHLSHAADYIRVVLLLFGAVEICQAFVESGNFTASSRALGGENAMIDFVHMFTIIILSFWLAHGDGRMLGGPWNDS